MRPFPFSDATRTLIRLALDEDLYAGDVTTDAIFSPDDLGSASFRAKETLTIAGIPVVEEEFRLVYPELQDDWLVADGETDAPGTTLGGTGPSAFPVTG